MKINLGSGMVQIAGYVGVDSDPETHPDMVMDVCDLSELPDCGVEEIYASHILEHLADPVAAMKEWHRVLRPGGYLYVAVPDPIQTYYLWKQGARWGAHAQLIDRSFLSACIFGSHRLGDTVPEMTGVWPKHNPDHQQVYFFDLLVQDVIAAGFDEVCEVTFCPVRRKDLGETMVQGRKLNGRSSCYTDEPWCLRRRAPLPEGE